MCDCASNQGFTTLDSCSAARSAPFWCSWSDTHCQVPDCVSTLDVFDPVTPVIVRCKLSGWHHGISPPTPPFRNHVPAFSSLKSLDEFRNTFWKLARPPRWLLQRAFCDLAPPLDGFCNPLPDGFCYALDGFCYALDGFCNDNSKLCPFPRWLLLSLCAPNLFPRTLDLYPLVTCHRVLESYVWVSDWLGVGAAGC